MKIVSACLAGINCRWDGTTEKNQKILELIKEGKAIPVCPEQLGGLSTPREPSEQSKDSVFTREGEDVTEEFERGAEEVMKIAKLANCKEAILKSKSPSCGSGQIYDGTFLGKTTKGDGILTKKLKEHGIKVITEEEI